MNIYTTDQALDRAWFYINTNQIDRAKIWLYYVVDNLKERLLGN